MDALPQRELEPHPDDWRDLERRAAAHKRWFYGRQPRPAAEVVAEVMNRRGYAQIRTARDHAAAWQEAAGRFAAVTEPGVIRRGVLEITVADSLTMQEISFDKERLLAAMQQSLPDAGIKQLRFRVGTIG